MIHSGWRLAATRWMVGDADTISRKLEDVQRHVKSSEVSSGRRADVIIDHVGGSARASSASPSARAPQKSRWPAASGFPPHLLDAVAKGTLKRVLDRTFPFDRLADAHKYMLSDAQTGKILLRVGDDKA